MRFKSRFAQSLAQESSSRLAKLDSLLREIERCLNPSRCVTVGEMKQLRERILYLLDEFGPGYEKQRDTVDQLNFRLPSGKAKPGRPLPAGSQKIAYGLLKRMRTMLKQARSIYTSRRIAVRADSRTNLAKLVRKVKAQCPPEMTQRELSGKIDDICEAENKPVPLPASWKKAGANSLLAAYDSPRLKKSVKSFLSKIKNPAAR